MRQLSRGFVAVFAREIGEHRLIPGVGLLLALVALAIPHLVPSDSPAEDVTTAAATALGLGYAALLAFALGISGIPAELAGGQQSFYFSRPIGSLAIWAGKLSSALLLALTGGLLAAAPAAPRALGAAPGQLWTGILAAATGLALILGIGHFLSLAFRSRGPWLLFDLGWVLAALVIGYFAYTKLAGALAGETWQPLLAARLLALVPCLILATAVQVYIGRSDMARSHKALSLMLGGCVLVLSASLALAASRVANPVPSRLAGIETARPVGEGWLFVRGWPEIPSLRHNATFLWQPDSDRYAHLGVTEGWPIGSAGGSRIAWRERTRTDRAASLLNWADLSADMPVIRSSPLSIRHHATLCCLSPDGSRVAWREGQRTIVANLSSGERNWTHEFDGGFWINFGFNGNDGFWALRRRNESVRSAVLTLSTFDFSSGTEDSVDLGSNPWTSRVLWFAAGTRLLVGQVIYDTTTGQEIGRIDDTADGYQSAIALPDGRFMVLESYSATDSPAIASFKLYDSDGRRSREFELEAATVNKLGGLLSESEIVLATSQEPLGRGVRNWRLRALDLETGDQRTLREGAYPVAHPGAPADHPSSRLFIDAHGGLLRLADDGDFDLLTGGEVRIPRLIKYYYRPHLYRSAVFD